MFFYGSKFISQGHASAMDVLRTVTLVLFALGSAFSMLSHILQLVAAKTAALQLLYHVLMPLPDDDETTAKGAD